ncbi:ABC transporter permease subunit [Pleionea litopenaei]|uniref:ABC transporter permease subunit n=1 Tax=Pleionea litopenaei TaxID=3070815 RepID=A0AA51X8G2_9GAMM|nr:ABC transporter permease subunit [Pleionea sp. HL-JVS1]WMS88899.1 ABC transporter permease subunit [Pleionea sp. HL-JVS1]
MNDLSNDYEAVKDRVRELLDKQTEGGHHTLRRIKDVLARHSIAIGGVSVIVAVVMIFFYLLYVVFPIFRSAEVLPQQSYQVEASQPLLWGMEEYGEVAFRIEADGQLNYYYAQTGEAISQLSLPLEDDEQVTQAVFAHREESLVAVALSSGRVLMPKLTFSISYPNDVRTITPGIEYPFGEDGLQLMDSSIESIAAAKSEEYFSIVTSDAEQNIAFQRFELQESFLTDGVQLELLSEQALQGDFAIKYLLHDPTGHWVYLIGVSGELQSYWLEGDELIPNERLSLVANTEQVTDVKLLLGGISLLVGDNTGKVSQWFPVRDDNNTYRLNLIRSFEFGDADIKTIIPEIRRKGFYVIDAENNLGIFYTTSHREVLSENIAELSGESRLILNPRTNRMLIASADKVHVWSIENEHPDLSWSALWSKVWYESYPEPQYTWQSSASTTDFEAKFSLVPLSFGTLKAAFYAMLFAMPLAICGAIFTAYFMAPKMRSSVKPAIEIMEALPTVILGFLAGLWLAPVMEENLPGVFMILILMPLAIVGFGLIWHFLPSSVTSRIPDGWQAALLVPVVILIAWGCFAISYPMEKVLFDGNMRVWLESIGITYDQRNSLVVGIAMGFAVIPTIFSIAEDAIFSVPKHLSNGSLALGASPWQTLVRVVLPTASPGIFSAVMIGLGRAVGETMIVLMATGNTPIMEANIFEGMRTLSANIAVEMPESEVGSSHYRVLFLAGFVLFVFTFVFNTLAENVRHRLRRKYGSL